MRLGVFGGTFDPIHSAHLTVAREAAAACALERVLFIPAAQPPHKPLATGASFADRFAMVRLACGEDIRFEPSRLEEAETKSYSIVTLQKLQSNGDELFFIIGADAFAEITTWYRWREVIEATSFIVVTRPGHSYAVPAGARVHRLDTLALPVSSSEIRAELAAGRLPAELPAAVAAYILERQLYGWPYG